MYKSVQIITHHHSSITLNNSKISLLHKYVDNDHLFDDLCNIQKVPTLIYITYISTSSSFSNEKTFANVLANNNLNKF